MQLDWILLDLDEECLILADVEDLLWLEAFSESLLLILGDWETNVSLANVGQCESVDNCIVSCVAESLEWDILYDMHKQACCSIELLEHLLHKLDDLDSMSNKSVLDETQTDLCQELPKLWTVLGLLKSFKKNNNLVVFYYLRASEIWLDKWGDS